MSTVIYTDPERVVDHKTTTTPRSRQTLDGYGPKVATSRMVRYVGDDGRARWHRVYVMVYGNSGSPYIIVGGQDHHLDTETEHRLEED